RSRGAAPRAGSDAPRCPPRWVARTGREPWRGGWCPAGACAAKPGRAAASGTARATAARGAFPTPRRAPPDGSVAAPSGSRLPRVSRVRTCGVAGSGDGTISCASHATAWLPEAPDLTARRLVVAAAVLAIAGVGWWLAEQKRAGPLPPTIVIDDAVAVLSRNLDGATILAGAASDPVRTGEIRPGNRLAGQGERPSLIEPPPARVRFTLDVPEGGVLRFGVGVQGDGRHDRQRSGVRFVLSLDGREVWTRIVNPALTRHDRRWFDERIDLGAAAGRRAEIVLATEAERPGHPLAGTPGWADVRLVRETRLPRQASSTAKPNVIVLLVDTLRA